MRLNAEMRAEIKRFAMAQLNKERQTFALIEQELMVECYNIVVPKATRDAIAALGAKWFKHDGSLSFNVAGQTVRFTQANLANPKKIIPFPVPPHHQYDTLGVIAYDKHKKLVDRIRDWQGKVEKEQADYETAVKTLDQLLKSVSTVEKLKQYWPEGKDFFSSPPCQARAASGVPAVQIEALNKMLGLKTEDLVI